VDVEEVMLIWREEGVILVATVVPWANEEVLEEDKEMTLWFIVTTTKR